MPWLSGALVHPSFIMVWLQLQPLAPWSSGCTCRMRKNSVRQAFTHIKKWSWDNRVNIVVGLWPRLPINQGSIPSTVLSFEKHPDCLWYRPCCVVFSEYWGVSIPGANMTFMCLHLVLRLIHGYIWSLCHMPLVVVLNYEQGFLWNSCSRCW